MPTLHTQEKANKGVCKPEADSEERANSAGRVEQVFPRAVFPGTTGRCGLLSLGKSAVAISAGQRAGHRPLLYRGQRPGLLALVLASIFEKLLDRKTLLSGAVFHHVYVSP